ncbi:MAG TPA: hypothetical protein VKB58_12195 [Terriglobales bacterium]|nr:hypothetical protein [Terriglobales bacterium]
MPGISRMVVLGDSVVWGQGLLTEHKFASLVAQALGSATPPQFVAHSGAVIGIGRANAPGASSPEIPYAYPTILTQCNSFNDNPDSVDLVLVNGGINDVDTRTILNPLTSFVALGDRTELHCYADMKVLLPVVAAKFSNPNTKIVVTSYYPILSTDSDPFRVPHLLQFRGIALPDFLDTAPLIGKIFSLCLQFWHDSEMWLGRAVAETNAALGGNRIRFAVAPFSEQNAVFASDPWLWGVGLPPDFPPEDEVASKRIPACDSFYGGNLGDLLACEECHRASAGHPNRAGASAFARAVEQALS